MEYSKRIIYKMDAIEEREAKAFDKRMENKGYSKCKKCGYWVEDTTNKLCESCIDEILDEVTLDEVLEYAAAYNDDFVLLTEYLFTKEQAKQLLKAYAKDALKLDANIFRKDIKEYIENDISHYLDHMEKRSELKYEI